MLTTAAVLFAARQLRQSPLMHRGTAATLEGISSVVHSVRRYTESLTQNGGSTGAGSSAIIGYITDVEGCGEYFNRYVDLSRVLRRDPVTNAIEIRDPSKHHFVFGGDLFDKGPHDLRLAKQLVDLKKKYPNNVHLIVGNRDINKAKLAAELDPAYIRATPDGEDVTIPFFCGQKNAMTYREWLTHERATHAHQTVADGPASRLKWHMTTTMGCPTTFEFRRRELAELARQKQQKVAPAAAASDTSITDDEVARSYYEQVSHPDGIVYQYLELSQLAAVIGDTLFVHGSVNRHALGFVPDATPGRILERRYRNDSVHHGGGHEGAAAATTAITSPHGDGRYHEELVKETTPPDDIPGSNTLMEPSKPGTKGVTLKDWVDRLNAFYKEGFAQWKARPQWTLADPNATHTSGRRWQRGGAAWFMYGHMGAMGPKTVMVTNFLSHGTLSYVDLPTVLHLNAHGVFRVVCGHQPAGDTPSVVRQPGLTVIMADNSYCDMKSPDGRGRAVSEVLIDVDAGTCRCHGFRVDGMPFDADMEHELNGVRLRDGRWTKMVLAEGDSNVGSGAAPTRCKVLVQDIQKVFHDVRYEWLSADEVQSLLHGQREGVGRGDVPSEALGATQRRPQPIRVQDQERGYKHRSKPSTPTSAGSVGDDATAGGVAPSKL